MSVTTQRYGWADNKKFYRRVIFLKGVWHYGKISNAVRHPRAENTCLPSMYESKCLACGFAAGPLHHSKFDILNSPLPPSSFVSRPFVPRLSPLVPHPSSLVSRPSSLAPRLSPLVPFPSVAAKSVESAKICETCPERSRTDLWLKLTWHSTSYRI